MPGEYTRMDGTYTIEKVSTVPASVRSALRSLWNSEYPIQLSLETPADLDTYLDGLIDATHWLAFSGSNVVAWSFTFNREDRRWFAIIVDTKAKGNGLGRELMQNMMATEQALEGWVTDHDHYLLPDGLPYISPLHFYLKLGFKLKQGERLETNKLSLAKIYWEK